MSPLPRLLFVITSLDRGGAQRQVVDLAARFRADGTTVAVLSMVRPEHYVDELRALGVQVFSLRMHRGRPTPLAFLRYGRFLRRWRPSLVHSHMVHANLLARLGRLFAPRVPVVCTVHNVTEGGRWREIAYRLTDRLATRTTAVSEAAAQRYVAIGAVPAGRMRMIPNGFEVRTNDPAPRAKMRAETRAGLGVGPDHFLWLAAGRLDQQKGFDLLLDAFSQVAADRPAARLALAGEGPERQALEAQLDHLGLRGVASLLGDRPDVPGLLAAADAFVLSSRWEGLPMVLLEAAAAGLPIVATDVGGDRDVVRPELGGILTDASVAGISAAMRRLMDLEPGERAAIGEALRGNVQDVFDLDAVVATWRRLYDEVTAGSGRR